ncbi:MAG: hypothetical protein LBK52_06640, partial [Deltaproteobacteria bacterium]|nr:hypothetical protein [Deltaproteobacteria bacterium]
MTDTKRRPVRPQTAPDELPKPKSGRVRLPDYQTAEGPEGRVVFKRPAAQNGPGRSRKPGSKTGPPSGSRPKFPKKNYDGDSRPENFPSGPSRDQTSGERRFPAPEGEDRPRRSFSRHSEDGPRRSGGPGRFSKPSFRDGEDRPRRTFSRDSEDGPRRSGGPGRFSKPSFRDGEDRPRRTFSR